MELEGAVKIGAAARAAGISVKMARHYEATGLLPPAVRDKTGSRLFTRADIHTLRFVGGGRSLGFSLSAIRKLLSLWQNAHRSNAETLDLAERHMTDLLHKQSELAAMVGTLCVWRYGWTGSLRRYQHAAAWSGLSASGGARTWRRDHRDPAAE